MQTSQMEADRLRREADDRREREQERGVHPQELADQRTFQQGIIEMLTAEREQFPERLQAEREHSNLMMTRFLNLAGRSGNRNGNGAPSGE